MKLTYKDWMLEYLVEWDVLFVLSLYVEQDRRQGTATKLMNMLLEQILQMVVLNLIIIFYHQRRFHPYMKLH